MSKVPCFWCGAFFGKNQLTKDHVIPKGVGGSNKKGNIVKACESCNNDRGKVVSIYLGLKELSNRKDISRWNTINRAFAKLDGWLALQNKWKKIEKNKLGYSPTANMKLEVIDGRTKKVAVVGDSVKEYAATPKKGFRFVVVGFGGEKYVWGCGLAEAKNRAKFLKNKNKLIPMDYSI